LILYFLSSGRSEILIENGTIYKTQLQESDMSIPVFAIYRSEWSLSGTDDNIF